MQGDTAIKKTRCDAHLAQTAKDKAALKGRSRRMNNPPSWFCAVERGRPCFVCLVNWQILYGAENEKTYPNPNEGDGENRDQTNLVNVDEQSKCADGRSFVSLEAHQFQFNEIGKWQASFCFIYLCRFSFYHAKPEGDMLSSQLVG